MISVFPMFGRTGDPPLRNARLGHGRRERALRRPDATSGGRRRGGASPRSGARSRTAMRLRAVERGHRLPQRLKLMLIRLVSGRRVPDVVKTLIYRSEFFGRPMCDWTQAVMRGPSAWSVGERELFAAFTSRLNQCVF